MVKLFKSAWFLFVFVCVTAFYYSRILMNRFLMFLIKKQYPSEKAHMLAVKWGRAFFKGIPGWNIKIIGKEMIPNKGPYVIVANHESGTDILAIYFLGVQFRWLSKKSVFSIPMVGGAMKACGYVPIKRGDKQSHVEAMDKSEQIIKSGIPMLFFPEGTRSVTGTPGLFKIGAFRLAQKCNVPVLPVVLHGAGELLRKKSICPMSATVTLKVLPLMASKPDEDPVEFTERVRKVIVKNHNLVKGLKKNERLKENHKLLVDIPISS